MRKVLFLWSILMVAIGCDTSDDNDSAVSPCSVDKQGFTMEAVGLTPENYYLDDSQMVVEYVTGHPDGPYYHIYSLQSPQVDFYTFGVNSGDQTTIGQNFNSTNGSFFSFMGSPLPSNNNFVVQTISSGSNIGDHIQIEMQGYIPGGEGGSGVDAKIFLCVTIDKLNTLANHAYITDGSNLKIYDISNPIAPNLVQTITAPTSYYVETVADIAYVGHFDAIQPFVSYVHIASPPSAYIMGTVAKGSNYARLTDVQEVNGYTYLSDEYRGLHIIHHMFNTQSRFSTSDAMSMGRIDNLFFLVDQNNGLHSYDVATANNPVSSNVSNTADLDLSSYPYSNGSFHSRIATYGNQHIIAASMADSKLKKFNSNTLSLSDEINIGGYTTALAVAGTKAIVSMRPSPDAPLQSSYDGIKLIELTSMGILDSKSLQNASGVAINGDYVYATDSNGLHIYQIQNNNLVFIRTISGGFGNYIALDN
ncbi:MAG: hypothetical protein OIF50_10720 [Flavobacteriaceae bacterium]|nr:hypothetical protein [Flavobacteriaceae bacterium]